MVSFRRMKLITRDVDYAIRALRYIAGVGGERVAVPELAKRLKIPRPFLRKILQVLHRRGILKAYKGQGGGFQLARPAEEILLINLIEIFRGRLVLNKCLFKKRLCGDVATCALKGKIDAIERRVVSELKAITLKSLLEESPAHGYRA